jgi:phosphomannomutase / phosphoglucomutase
MNPHIFRQYDIRGIVGRDLDERVAENIGRSFATLLRRSRGGELGLRVALGRDNRLTSDALAEAVSRGITATGVDVIDVGTVPTPVQSFAAAYLETDGGLQVTGSHNPAEYNGFKMTIGGGSLYGEKIQELLRIIREEDYEEGRGTTSVEEIIPTYIRVLAEKFSVGKRLKVVVDCGNGSGSLVAVDLLRAISDQLEIIPLFCDSDGTFPNHHPDPVVDENLADLIAAVRNNRADLGVAFDGDADRIGAVDDQGSIVRGDILLLLFALDLIDRVGPDHPIVFDVKCSQVLPEELERAGGKPIMSQTGHSLIKKRMKEEGSLLSGELSGHIMFGEDYYGFDDALYGAALLISIISKLGRPLSERLAELPRFVSTSELRYPSPEEEKFRVVGAAVKYFSREHEVIDVDGARVLFGDGWGLIRASNTEPALVARYEARSADRLKEIRSTMEDWLRTQGVDVQEA